MGHGHADVRNSERAGRTFCACCGSCRTVAVHSPRSRARLRHRLGYAIHGRSRAEQIGAVAVAVAVAAPWLLWTRLDTGAWVTQTARAKQLFLAEGCRPWIEKGVTVLRATGTELAQLFPLSLGVVALFRDKLGRAGLLAILVTTIAYSITFPGGRATVFSLPHRDPGPWLCLGFS